MAINGFGRIGRAALKIAIKNKDLDLVAINDLTDNKTLAHLLYRDTVYGAWEETVTSDDKNIIVGGKSILSLAEKDPGMLPWKDLGIDIVLDCTGIFLTKETAAKHLQAGARKVVLSAPPKDDSVPTYVLGVNSEEYRKNKEKIVSNSSCTTNCITPVMAILQKHFKVQKSMMITAHSYTADQNLVDGPHRDLRRARAAAQNIVPTTTGAAISTTKIIPELAGKFDGLAIRVPTPVVSIADITAVLAKSTTAGEINEIFTNEAAAKNWQGILAVSNEPLVSSDLIKNPYSSIIDLALTKVVDGNLIKVVAWYDNEWGYANRLVELAKLIAEN